MQKALGRVVTLLVIGSLGVGLASAQVSPENEQTLPGLPGVTVTAKPRKAEPEAMLKCQQLKGYAKLQEEFIVEHAQQGYINRLDESLFTMLLTDKARTLNAAWWLNPIVRGKPRYDWDAFLALFHHVDNLLSLHTWLAGWRTATGGRLLELHAFGREPASESDNIVYDVLPIWREAGFAGKPQYEVLARLGDTSWLRMFLNDKDPRLLVSYTMDLPVSPAHWLDGLNVEFHPNCEKGQPSSKYVVIEPIGQWRVHEYSKC